MYPSGLQKRTGDWRGEWKNVEVKYDATNKTVGFSCGRIAFVPSYCYYLCKHLEQQYGRTIDKVIFLIDTSRQYRLEELKGVNNWDELDLKDLERSQSNESE